MENDYTKRELDMKFESLESKIDENHKETVNMINLLDRRMGDKQKETVNFLEEIKTQTTEHNHRMTKQETMTKGIAFALKIASPLVVLIIGLIVYIYQYQLAQQTIRITTLRTEIQTLQNKN